jgi:predicted Rossmann fold nucleotide-binding protein DprA/Smf involved in DNA uptake
VFEDLAPELVATVRSATSTGAAPRIDATEFDVLRTLDDSPVAVDEIARTTGRPPGRIAVVLAAVELRGLTARIRGGFCITEAGARAVAAAAAAAPGDRDRERNFAADFD